MVKNKWKEKLCNFGFQVSEPTSNCVYLTSIEDAFHCTKMQIFRIELLTQSKLTLHNILGLVGYVSLVGSRQALRCIEWNAKMWRKKEKKEGKDTSLL